MLGCVCKERVRGEHVFTLRTISARLTFVSNAVLHVYGKRLTSKSIVGLCCIYTAHFDTNTAHCDTNTAHCDTNIAHCDTNIAKCDTNIAQCET